MNVDIEATAKEHGQFQQELWKISQTEKSAVLPDASSLARARSSLPQSLDDQGIGYESTRRHILDDLVPAFNLSSISPALLWNVQVHLPEHTIATDVEYATLGLLIDLLRLDHDWLNGTFTTGATASNILGLACGREYVVRQALRKRRLTSAQGVGETGLFEAMHSAGLSGIQVLSTMPHSSLVKAAGVLGIGRSNVQDVSADNDPLVFDLNKVEARLRDPTKAAIVAVSCGEVNTGHFATSGLNEMQKLRKLCDEYGAWLHVDGAFGIFGIELADSIAGDGHKILNVPYECGFFLTRHRDQAMDVFQNANAAYLTGSASDAPSKPSPLNIGLENSRRFRALPVYASLLAYGSRGYQATIEEQIRLARKIAEWLYDHPKYNVLPEVYNKKELRDKIYVVVLFSAKDDELNRQLTATINETRRIYVSGTSWQNRPACRIAISNWRVQADRDFLVVKEVLDGVAGNKV
ncbi:pyridoxal phosphate-dependent transferase [Aspergillus desertorum]